jgi:hypothetical protein
MDFVHDQLATGRKLPGADDRRHPLAGDWSRAAFPSAGLMSLRCWKESGERWGRRQAFALTRVPSSCCATWIWWAYQRVVRLDILRPESRLITHSSRPSIAVSELNVRNARTGRSARRRRLCYSTTLAQPARHREQAGKIYPPAIQSSASVQSTDDSAHRWMRQRAQLTHWFLSLADAREKMEDLKVLQRGTDWPTIKAKGGSNAKSRFRSGCYRRGVC